MPRIYALADCNSFYCSCERVFKPHLDGKPVLVLSNNDGCAIALTPEVKKLGVKMGDPFFQLKDLIKRHNIAVFSSNYTLYGDMSRRVMTTLEQQSTELEIYSIDEAFLDLAGLAAAAIEPHAREVRAIVKRNTGIPISIGIGASKTLAKIANKYAKKVPESGGVLDMSDPARAAAILPLIACADIWGIGPASTAWLETIGIRTAAQLRDADPKRVRKHMGVVGERVVYELRGVSCLPLELVAAPKKGICCSRAFGRYITDQDEVRAAVQFHIMRGAEKLRFEGVQAKHLTVFIQGNPFSSVHPYYGRSTATTLAVPTDYTPDLAATANMLFDRIWRPGVHYMKAGIFLNDFVPASTVKVDLFDDRDRDKQKRVMQAMDQINARYGSRTVQLAAMAGVRGADPAWSMRREYRSPHYTTSWAELATVR